MASEGFRTDLVAYQPDWWGRLLGLCSLLVSGAVLYWTYQTYQSIQPKLDQAPLSIANAVDQGLKDLREVSESERLKIRSELQASITELRSQVERLVLESTPTRQPEVKAPVEFEEPIRPAGSSSKSEGLSVAEGTEGTGPAAQPEVQPEVQPDRVPIVSRIPVTEAPRLVAKRITLRAIDLGDRPTLTIRNSGNAPAEVRAIRFEPVEIVNDVPNDLSVPQEPATRDGTRLQIIFQKEENLAQNPKDQGAYARVLVGTFTIPSGADCDVHLGIANREHVGYGLKGQLTIVDLSGTEFRFEDVMIPFMVPTESKIEFPERDKSVTPTATTL